MNAAPTQTATTTATTTPTTTTDLIPGVDNSVLIIGVGAAIALIAVMRK